MPSIFRQAAARVSAGTVPLREPAWLSNGRAS
jgi:hypothetical protein